jgi:hypothetical protein
VRRMLSVSRNSTALAGLRSANERPLRITASTFPRDCLATKQPTWPPVHDGRRVRVQRVGEPSVTEVRTWGAHERIAVKRAGT